MSRPPEVTTLGSPGAPGVLLLHPWWGVTPAVHWWADQLVSAGRRVVVPDLFGGALPTTEADAEEHAQAALGDPATRESVQRCADGLAAEGRPWAAMGFSLGAFLACSLSGRGAADPDQLVLFYGGRPPSGSDVRTRRVDLHVAPGDPWFPDDERSAVEGGFRDAGAEVVVHRYPGCGHWFAEAGSPGHVPAATDLARDRVLDLLRDRPADR
ncbi:dienelactone hydrolase family protein [Geodermatophilus sabuli]|uniref:Dienelactone hydrolase family protein n=1 Tax=Geodermatophilus sabuli TaxID=1564158 RepID=A0A7K3VZT2_9ACTN|nr:dienelactone hydrolase family protein [Geodermatophilus sabuli]